MSGNFPGLVQAFFTDRLLRQRNASPHTVAGYRDTFRLLLHFAEKRLKKVPARLALDELDAPLIGSFLDYIEKERGNSARSRNTRLAAIHSFYRYVSFQEPAHADLCRRILAIPSKRYHRKLIEYLTPEEIDALLAAPDRTTWIGRRDQALLLVGIETGRGCPNSLALSATTSFWAPALISVAKERVEKSGAPHFARKQLRS